jgi:hypothetical protein
VQGYAFKLIEVMGEKRVADGGPTILFKLLTEAYLQHIKGKAKNEKLTAEAALSNFLHLFRSNETMPASHMVEPFVAMVQNRLKLKQKHFISSSELNFIIQATELSRLTQKAVVAIIELFSLLYMA